MRWLRLTASERSVDPERTALVGSPSGGHLALLAATRPDGPEHRGVPVRRRDLDRILAARPSNAGATRQATLPHLLALGGTGGPYLTWREHDGTNDEVRVRQR